MACGANNPFLFVFTYRPVASNHPFLQLITSLEEQNNCNVVEVSLNCLRSDDVHEMVSSIFGEYVGRDIRPLSDFMFRITNGSESNTLIKAMAD